MASSREFDFVLFGATGFTGKYVAEELDRIQKEGKRSFKWAAAGRNEERVKEALEGEIHIMTEPLMLHFFILKFNLLHNYRPWHCGCDYDIS